MEHQNYKQSQVQGQDGRHENVQAYAWPHIDQSYGAYYAPLIPKSPPRMPH